MHDTYGLWAEKDFYRATPFVIRGLGFLRLNQKTILNNVAFYVKQVVQRRFITSILKGTKFFLETIYHDCFDATLQVLKTL